MRSLNSWRPLRADEADRSMLSDEGGPGMVSSSRMVRRSRSSAGGRRNGPALEVVRVGLAGAGFRAAPFGALALAGLAILVADLGALAGLAGRAFADLAFLAFTFEAPAPAFFARFLAAAFAPRFGPAARAVTRFFAAGRRAAAALR